MLINGGPLYSVLLDTRVPTLPVCRSKQSRLLQTACPTYQVQYGLLVLNQRDVAIVDH